MSQWTGGANERWDQYCQNLRKRLQHTDADADEVIEDIRRHLETEIAASNLSIVTEQDIQRIVQHFGYPDGEGEQQSEGSVSTFPQPPASLTVAAEAGPPETSAFGSIYLILFGVLLPLGAATFEVFTRICTSLFFDPLPTVWHAALFFIIPLSNLAVYLAVRGNRIGWLKGLGLLNGLAIGAALFYTIWFLPIIPFSFIALLFIGIGICGLAPALALIAAIIAARRLRLLSAARQDRRIPWVRTGFVTGLALPLLLVVPTLITILGLNLAVHGTPDERAQGIQLMRRLGSKDSLLRRCYDNREADLWGIDWDGTGSASVEEIRGIYYLVTGKAFNTQPPNFRGFLDRGQTRMFDDWDFEQGGDVVGGQLKHVELRSSQLDGLILPDAAMGYLEWTMEFQNHHEFDEQEARCQIQLPPGGVVSRVTLWIDGVEREAAFGGRSQTKEAYQSVAIRQRRDPLLVTTKGPDQVLVQCFPILPRGEKMKIRIGMTFPLELLSREQAVVPLPTLIERNFRIPETTPHRIWIESGSPLTAEAGLTNEFVPDKQIYAVRGPITDRQLLEHCADIRASRNPEVFSVWAQKAFPHGEVKVVQTLHNSQAKALIDKMVLVVDTSAGMKSHLDAIRRAIESASPGFDLEVIAADDVMFTAAPDLAAEPEDRPVQRAVDAIRHLRASGGVDNLPALVEAWHRAATSENAVILWVHSAQPHIFEPVDALTQCWQRRPGGPPLLHLQAVAGPNRIVENLDGVPQVQSVYHSDDLAADLQRLFRQLSGESPRFTLTRLLAEAGIAPEGQETSSHLIRLWAKEEVESLRKQRSAAQQENAKMMAVNYQLVTPVSGAVVLETMEQYLRHNLQPVDPESVPTIPEPATLLLMGVGAMLLRGVRTRRRSAAT